MLYLNKKGSKVCCNGLRIVLMFTLVVISFALNGFMPNIPVLIWYLASVNVFTFLLFSIDKLNAIKNRKRVPEITLHFFSFAGGIIGAIISMFAFRHKIRKKLFLSIQSVILLLWIVSTYYVLTNLEAIQKALNI